MLELSLLGSGLGSPGHHRPASSSAIGPSHSGTGRPTGWSSLAISATGQSPVDTCPEHPEQGHSLNGPPTKPVDTCPERPEHPEQGHSLVGAPTRPVDTCPEPGNLLAGIRTGLVNSCLEQGHSLSGPRTSRVDTCSEQGNSLGGTKARAKIVPLSAPSYRVEFTASAELFAKLERASELMSHAVPGGELPTLIERALDTLIEREMRRRVGTGKARKQRPLKPGSRHVPREVARLVWQRDGGQCSFVDAEGRRCSERRYLTLEHRHPFALGGPPTRTIFACFASPTTSRARGKSLGKSIWKGSVRNVGCWLSPSPNPRSRPRACQRRHARWRRAHAVRDARRCRRGRAPKLVERNTPSLLIELSLGELQNPRGRKTGSEIALSYVLVHFRRQIQ